MPNFLADLGRGGPAITGALRDVTQTALTIEQLKGEKQNQAIRENELRKQKLILETADKEEERKNRVIPFNQVAQYFKVQEGTELYKEVENFGNIFGYIETINGEKVVSVRNIEEAVKQYKGNETRFWRAELNDLNTAIAKLKQPTEKPLKPEEQEIVKQQIMGYEARRTGVINALYGEEALKAQREKDLETQKAATKEKEMVLEYTYKYGLGEQEKEKAIAVEKLKGKQKAEEDKLKPPVRQTFEYMEQARRATYRDMKKAEDDGDIQEAEALKDIYIDQTKEIRNAYPKKEIKEYLIKKEEKSNKGFLDKFSEWFK